ncbi:DUF934 domain-containing protein [Pseudooceanicola sediminis]|uniref:DUF934 domain-containing protein n=1 Tax=Pseudooceanicola sediminis TaxID=2211117 RepID=A0A399IYH3_9RHOB|nr:DUF934 domain-containing protein [Pseudooceanicola sediminis]KAA2316123.1 DUF934 domain-containing protein [Puniceibacterium sp. HSS470]RII38233.1 DUF934 domain-containing protein [Pseudooceanicola sediminis]|tara:strand:- start:4579 stop:4965 length:387 start_codon:yes stop_codon:yes gene_type:complete
MSVIVTDAGFATTDWAADLGAQDVLTLASDTNPHTVDLSAAPKLVRVEFPSSADGRGFTIARVLRDHGYTGKLRATGHVIADQYAMARRCGFDDVEISDDLAARQPEDQWKFRSDWRQNDYQSRLRRA